MEYLFFHKRFIIDVCLGVLLRDLGRGYAELTIENKHSVSPVGGSILLKIALHTLSLIVHSLKVFKKQINSMKPNQKITD